MKFKSLHALLLATLLSVFISPVFATEITAQRYVQIEIAAREAALVGSEARLAQLTGEKASNQQARALSEYTHQSVNKVYFRSGISTSALLVWENRNRKAIEQWLELNPDVAQYYHQLNYKLNRLSDQIDAIQGH